MLSVQSISDLKTVGSTVLGLNQKPTHVTNKDGLFNSHYYEVMDPETNCPVRVGFWGAQDSVDHKNECYMQFMCVSDFTKKLHDRIQFTDYYMTIVE